MASKEQPLSQLSRPNLFRDFMLYKIGMWDAGLGLSALSVEPSADGESFDISVQARLNVSSTTFLMFMFEKVIGWGRRDEAVSAIAAQVLQGAGDLANPDLAKSMARAILTHAGNSNKGHVKQAIEFVEAVGLGRFYEMAKHFVSGQEQNEPVSNDHHNDLGRELDEQLDMLVESLIKSPAHPRMERGG
mgnify:CR=1 FL=1